jgi:hypothetical protein
MEGAIAFHYGRPSAGREKLAFEAFGEALGFFGKKAADGLCQAPVAYMGPSGGGMLIVGGDSASLVAIAAGEDFSRMFLKAGYAVPDLTYEMLLSGSDAVNQMGLWASVGSELGLI